MAKKKTGRTTASPTTRKKKAKSSKSEVSKKKKSKTVTSKALTRGGKKVTRKAKSGSAATRSRSKTKAQSVGTIAAPPVPEPIPKPPSITQLRKVKTGIGKKDMDRYRQLLLVKRVEILGDVMKLESDARSDTGNHLSPEDTADVGSNSYEQEFTLGLVESERRILREIDEALLRILNRTYGVCIETAVPIGTPRLEAKPWAKYCIEVVREKERRGEM